MTFLWSALGKGRIIVSSNSTNSPASTSTTNRYGQTQGVLLPPIGLVAAWLSDDTKAARKEISEIRDSIEFVLQETPWKFALWRAVVRAAGQRPVLEENTKDETQDHRKDEKHARKWLSRVLGRIACRRLEPLGEGQYQPNVWAKTWPKVDFVEHNDRNPSWRSFYLSYQSGHFLAGLGERNPNPTTSRRPSR